MPWLAGGLSIVAVLILAVALAQPISVLMQHVVLDGVLLHQVSPGIVNQSSSPAGVSGNWRLATYEFLFVVGISLGALLGPMTVHESFGVQASI